MYADAGDVRVEVDFLTKRFDNPADLPLNRDFADSEDAKDSLGANVKAFVSKALGETVSVPAATGRDGMLALETALRIDQAAGSRSRI